MKERHIISIPSSAIILFIGFLFSCARQTHVVKPETNLPSHYLADVDSASISQQPWNTFFQDTCLVNLIDKALQDNFQMKKMWQQISIAQATVRVARGGLLPEVSGNAGAFKRKFGTYTMDGVGNDDTNANPSLPEDKRIPTPYQEFTLGGSFSWEVDVWGKLNNQKRAAKARWLATQEEQHALTTWLVAEVATLYYELEGLDKEKEALVNNLELQEKGLALVKIQKEGGKVNQLAVDQFEAQLLNTQSLLLDTNQKIIVAESEINKLLGKYPQSICRQDILTNKLLETIQSGIPTDLIRQRPDIRQAEWELFATQADVRAARAAFFPSLRVYGAAGFASFDFSKLFISPESSIYQLGAGLVAPLFQRNQLKAMFQTANAQQEIALVNYQQIVLNSYYEVYTTLSSYRNLQSRIELKQNEVNVQKRFIENFNTLFSAGYSTYVEVIIAQQRLLEAELALATLKKEQLQSLVIVYRALGGGWTQPS